MTPRSLAVAIPLCALALTGCQASVSTEPKAPSILPLRTLRLFETGVGYFERSGGIDPRQATSLPVPAGHLDDALKSLVILSADGKAKVHGLELDEDRAFALQPAHHAGLFILT